MFGHPYPRAGRMNTLLKAGEFLRWKVEDCFKGEAPCLSLTVVHSLPTIRLHPSFLSSSESWTNGRAGVATVRLVEPRGVSPLFNAIATVTAQQSVSSRLWSFSTHRHSTGQKNRMYSPTPSPSRTAPSSSHRVFVMGLSPVSPDTEIQQVQCRCLGKPREE